MTMKKYTVKTQSDYNAMLLHSTMQREFATDDIAEAQMAFDKEVEALEAQYVKADAFEYSPSDAEYANAAYCEIVELIFDEDGEVEDIESVVVSDRYYEK